MSADESEVVIYSVSKIIVPLVVCQHQVMFKNLFFTFIFEVFRY